MKRVVILLGALTASSGAARAQDESVPAADPEPAAEPATEPAAEPAPEPAPTEEPKKRSPYYKKVQGWLWIEGFVGPTSYDPDRFASIASEGNAPTSRGAEGGIAIGTAFGGPFFLGWFYRQANYGDYKLLKTGLDMQGTLRFVPYVHPILRASIGYAKIFDGNPYGLANSDSDGVSFTGGVGVRVPIVRWISFAATFDWSFVGLSLRGDADTGARVQSWIGGRQFGATFALTFHFRGVRKN